MSGKQKVWIITRRAGYNFGSSLQAYAIQQTVKKLGYENEIIDYDEYYHSIRWRIRPFFEDCLFYIMEFFKGISSTFFHVNYKHLQNRKLQRKKFDAFDRDYFKLTERRYRTAKEIAKDAFDCDACICGSDQIWCPLLFDPVMFLNFCDKNTTKTIAYAPSFGITTITSHKSEILQLIKNIQFLSIREKSGADIIKSLLNKDVFVALDPTLLLNSYEWKKLCIKPTIDGPYILTYFLGNKHIPYDFIKGISDKTNFRIVNIQMYYNVNAIEGINLATTSPQEFLGLIENASYICTDSFHGTVFSILFEKQFFSFARFKNSAKNNQNSRINNLLDNVMLTDRLIPSNCFYNHNNQVIDYVSVKQHLQKYIEQSIDYLKNSLQ